MIFHQLLAQSLVRLGRAKKHAVRHNAGAAAALLQHTQKQSHKKQLGFFGVGNRFQIVVNTFRVHRTLKRRISQANGEFIADSVLLGNAVQIINLRRVNRMKH